MIFTIHLPLLAAVAFLLFSSHAGIAADTVDWKKDFMTIAPVKREPGGKLLPLQSYDKTISRGMSFILDDHLKWFKGAGETLTDEHGKAQMPWVYYSNLQHNGAPFPKAVDRFTSYPAFHHALMIKTFLRYGKHADDRRALEEAIKLADWDIAHSTPSDWAYGNMPYSTFEHKKPGGFRDGAGIMPDKAAILALAYLDLYEICKKVRFLKAAEAIGKTLSLRQRPNGTWPFRVNPKTEKVVEEYTSSVIYAVMLFERLDKLNGNNNYKSNRDKTWKWLVNGPIKTKEFRGFYEDIPPSPKGRTNYDCLDTIRYLLANRNDANGYLDMAKDLNTWIEKIFLDKIKGFEPAEGIREQTQCNFVMGIHSLNWASMLMELADASGDEAMRQRAMQTANYTTYYLQPDNRIVVGFDYKQFWYSCHVGVVLYLFDFIDDQPKHDLQSFKSGQLWPDNNGTHINAHGGGVLFHEGTYYWFGEHKVAGNAGNRAQVGVHVYSSKDLYNWKDGGIALKVSDAPKSDIVKGCIIERPKVIYNAKTGKFVMWFHLELKGRAYHAARSGIAVADKPCGPYRFIRSIRPNAAHWPLNVTDAQKDKESIERTNKENDDFSGGPTPKHAKFNILGSHFEGGQMARDMNLFVDDDGRAYHIYSSEHNSTLHISLLTDDYMDHAGTYTRNFPFRWMEAPAVFKRGGKYYLIASGCTGWAPNAARSAVADTILGPWKELENPCAGTNPANKMGPSKTFGGQSTCVFQVQGKKDTYIAMFDIWRPEDAIDGRYIWLPIRFSEKAIKIEWQSEWNLLKPEVTHEK